VLNIEEIKSLSIKNSISIDICEKECRDNKGMKNTEIYLNYYQQ